MSSADDLKFTVTFFHFALCSLVAENGALSFDKVIVLLLFHYASSSSNNYNYNYNSDNTP
mgnify:CR=1 FL=1